MSEPRPTNLEQDLARLKQELERAFNGKPEVVEFLLKPEKTPAQKGAFLDEKCGGLPKGGGGEGQDKSKYKKTKLASAQVGDQTVTLYIYGEGQYYVDFE